MLKAFDLDHANSTFNRFVPEAEFIDTDVDPARLGVLDRLRVLTDAATASAARGEMVTLQPADAAARIVQALRDWGYLPTS